ARCLRVVRAKSDGVLAPRGTGVPRGASRTRALPRSRPPGPPRCRTRGRRRRPRPTAWEPTRVGDSLRPRLRRGRPAPATRSYAAAPRLAMRLCPTPGPAKEVRPWLQTSFPIWFSVTSLRPGFDVRLGYGQDELRHAPQPGWPALRGRVA